MPAIPTPLAVIFILMMIGLVAKILVLAMETPFIQARLRSLSGKGQGDYVAEVMLTWYFGTGSVLYRQRFASEEAALAAAKRQAKVLDNWLPRFYYDTDWSGNRIALEHEYGIAYGVRQVSDAELKAFTALDKRTLPGY